MSALRTEDLHQPADHWDTAVNTVPANEPHTYVTFELAGQIFAVDVSDVREILDMQPISQLPNAPGDLLGMIDVRGEGIAVVDLPGRLNLRHKNAPEDSRILVFELGDNPCKPVGVIADRVLAVEAIIDGDIEPTPSTTTNWESGAMVGVTRIDGKLTMILALNRLFESHARGPFDFE